MKNKVKDEMQGFWLRQNDGSSLQERGDEGYLLVGAVVAIFLVMLALGVAAAKVSKQLQREREVETVHRANEYVRAIRVFYRKNGNQYPTSIDQLENTNNQRYLRQQFVDPLTGKADWRLIHLSENLTTVKGFFGEELPGLASGLGSAASMASPGGTGSAFSNSGIGGGLGGNSTTGGLGGSANAGTSAFGGGTGSGQTTGATGSGTTGTGTTGSSTTGSSSSSSSSTGSVGLIIGVGSAKTGESIVDVNGQNTYETWEFLYDPRIEQMYAKATLFGGAISSGSAASGLGSAAGMASPGQGINTPTGTAPTTVPTSPPPPQ